MTDGAGNVPDTRGPGSPSPAARPLPSAGPPGVPVTPSPASGSSPAAWPVEFIPTDDRAAPPADEVGLCLSGGGVRAMLFHVGALWRLNELGLLPRLDRVSSVSGGSITAGVLATRWSSLTFDPVSGVATNFVDAVVGPIRDLARQNIDIPTAVKGILRPGSSPARELARTLDAHLYHGATLQDLPERPRFVFNATNLQSSVLWRFSRAYTWDWRVGKIESPTFGIATAVASSSAFPPFFAPLQLDLDPAAFVPGSGDGTLDRPEFQRRVLLADGGVYDNLGIETVFKRCRTVLVSDGGGKIDDAASPATDWIREMLRVTKVIDNQVRSLRKRLLIDALDGPDRAGAYWGIRSALAEFPAPGVLPVPDGVARALAEMPTRLASVPAARQKALVDWGYAIADASLRGRYLRDAQPPTGFPYPGAIDRA